MEREKLGDKFQRWVELGMYVILLGFLWTVTSLGVVTVGASTTALNAAMRAYLLEGDRKPLNTFFRVFREKFKPATLVWLVHLALIAVLAVDLVWYSAGAGTLDNIATAAVSVLLTLLVFELSVVFACMVQYDLTGVRAVMERAFDLAFRCFVDSLELLVITAAVLLTGLFLLRAILPFAAGIIAALSWKLLPNTFRKYHFKTPKKQ